MSACGVGVYVCVRAYVCGVGMCVCACGVGACVRVWGVCGWVGVCVRAHVCVCVCLSVSLQYRTGYWAAACTVVVCTGSLAV